MNESTEALSRRGLARSLKVFLDVFFFLILAMGVLRIAGLSVSALTGYDEGWEFRVPVAVGEGSFYSRLSVDFVPDPGSRFTSKGLSQAGGTLILHHFSLPVHLTGEAITLLFYAVALWILTLLRRVLATTAGGRPFDPLNTRRLNTLGWIIVCSAALATVLQYFVSRRVLSVLQAPTTPLSPSLDFHQEWILCGLLVLVLSAIWKQAVRMAEEQALTV